MKRLLAIALISTSALAQEPPRVPLMVPLPGHTVRPLTERTVLRSTDGTVGHLFGFANATSFGLAGRVYLSLAPRTQTTPELSLGVFSISHDLVAQTFINGYLYSQGLFILPAYIGVRYNIAGDRSGSFEWNWYVRGGGGPAVGMLTPLGLWFLESISLSTFHLGVGAYAATGIEVTFDDSYSVFLQGGADYVGFLRRVGDRSSFVGPSVSIGFGRLIP